MDIELRGSTLKFKKVLDDNASVVDPDGKGDKYFFLPFWFEKTGPFSFRLHGLDGNLPRELTNHLTDQRTGFKTTEMEKRFKTKQELKELFRPDIVNVLGLAYGEPSDDDISSHFITTTPHPYKGKRIIIKITGPEQSKAVQEKAFKVGFSWVGGNTEVHNTDKGDLLLDKSALFFNPDDCGKDFTITAQQFLEGYLPTGTWEQMREENIHPHFNIMSGEEKKPDAFVVEARENLVILYKDGDKRYKETPGNLYKYNLMHANEYFALHPETLKFKEWEVWEAGEHIKVGCERVHKEDAEAFLKVMQLLNTHKADAKEAYVFLYTNKKKLGLDF